MDPNPNETEKQKAAKARLEESRRKLREAFLELPKETRDAIQTTIKAPEFKEKLKEDCAEICTVAARLSDFLKDTKESGLASAFKKAEAGVYTKKYPLKKRKSKL